MISLDINSMSVFSVSNKIYVSRFYVALSHANFLSVSYSVLIGCSRWKCIRSHSIWLIISGLELKYSNDDYWKTQNVIFCTSTRSHESSADVLLYCYVVWTWSEISSCFFLTYFSFSRQIADNNETIGIRNIIEVLLRFCGSIPKWNVRSAKLILIESMTFVSKRSFSHGLFVRRHGDTVGRYPIDNMVNLLS